MPKATLYPLLLEPALHVKVWGGRRLETVMHKHLPTAEPYGEAVGDARQRHRRQRRAGRAHARRSAARSTALT